MRSDISKPNRMIKALQLLVVFGSIGLLALTLQTNVNVSAVVLPIAVNQDHVSFGVSFPGEQRVTTFTISYTGSGEPATYGISLKRKPLPPDHPQYPNGGDPDMTGFYRNLCPSLSVTTSEAEGGTLALSSVSPTDASDVWTVTLATPAINGFVGQTHTGGIVSTNGEYGCDMAFEVIEAGPAICGDAIKNQAIEECDGSDGVGSHQFCNSGCQLENLTYCGDGIKQTPNGENVEEECDNTDGVPTGSVCSQDCALEVLPPAAFCGDGIRNQIAEECDGSDGLIQGYLCTDACLLQQSGSGGDCTDIDDDSYAAEGGACGSVDCNDNDSSINPGAAEICADGIDNNCDGLTDDQDTGACSAGGITTTIGGSGGGGGGSAGFTSLYIHSEQIANPLATSITITWYTNKPATSRVVYDTVSHPTIGYAPNYGYAFSNAEDSTKVLFHSMTITGLTPNTVYYFRPISSASPEVYGIELQSQTTSGGGTGTPGGATESYGTGGPETTGETGSGIVAGVALGGTAGSGTAGAPAGLVLGEATEEPTEPQPAEAAVENQPGKQTTEAAETAATPCVAYIWFLLVLNASVASVAWWRQQPGGRSPIAYGWLIGLLLAIIPTIIWYPACWLVTWLVITLVALIIVAALTKKEPIQPLPPPPSTSF